MARSCLLFLLFSLVSATPVSAQLIHDGFKNKVGQLEVAASATHSQFDQYYAGQANGSATLTDFGPGTVYSRSLSLYLNYGVNKWLDIVATTPYVWNRRIESESEPAQQAITQTALHGKFQLDSTHFDGFVWTNFATLGFNFPTQNYEDNLAYSVGHRVYELPLYFNTQLIHQSGLFVNLQGGTEVRWPDAPSRFSTMFRLGYGWKFMYFDIWLHNQNAFGGTESIKGEDSFINDNINFTKAGGTVYASLLDSFGLGLSGGKILEGQNVADYWYGSFSMVWQTNFKK